MLSELLISCAGTRQAAVLLHLTKSTRESERREEWGRTTNTSKKPTQKRHYLHGTLLHRSLAGHRAGGQISSARCIRPCEGLRLPSVYQGEQLEALPCTLSVWISCAFSLSRFRLYVIIFLSPNSVANLCNRTPCCWLRVCLSVHLM